MNESVKVILEDVNSNILNNYITNLQEENERIKKMNMHEHKYGSDMEDKYLIEKAKNDKAIEYLEKKWKEPEWWDTDFMICINILKGGDGTLKEALGDK